MRKYARQSAISALAPTKWAIAPAVLYGLIHGLTLLNESVDLATAVGIAGFISLAISPWLAVNLHRLLMRSYSGWIAALAGRITHLQASTLQASTRMNRDTVERRPGGSVKVGIVTRAVGYSFYATIFCFGGFTSGALLTIMYMQIQGIHHNPYLIGTATMFVALVVTIAVQCLYFGVLHRRVAKAAARHRSVGAPAVGAPAEGSSPVPTQAATLSDIIARAERFGCRLIGARPISAK